MAIVFQLNFYYHGIPDVGVSKVWGHHDYVWNKKCVSFLNFVIVRLYNFSSASNVLIG